MARTYCSIILQLKTGEQLSYKDVQAVKKTLNRVRIIRRAAIVEVDKSIIRYLKKVVSMGESFELS